MDREKHVGEDMSHSRIDEDVGYIVIERGHAVSGDIEIVTACGLDIVVFADGNFHGIHRQDCCRNGPAAIPAVHLLEREEQRLAWSRIIAESCTQRYPQCTPM
jgi:hypothetical protein